MLRGGKADAIDYRLAYLQLFHFCIQRSLSTTWEEQCCPRIITCTRLYGSESHWWPRVPFLSDVFSYSFKNHGNPQERDPTGLGKFLYILNNPVWDANSGRMPWMRMDKASAEMAFCNAKLSFFHVLSFPPSLLPTLPPLPAIWSAAHYAFQTRLPC